MQTTKNIQQPKEQVTTKRETSLLESAGLSSIETALHKIPFIGETLPFIVVNIVAACIFYYLCYAGLWIFARAPEEDGQWFVRVTDMVGKSQSRFTTFAAVQIAYFVAGVAACLFTFANIKEKKYFFPKAALIALIPIGLYFVAKVFPIYISMALIYGQFIAIVIVCIVKLLGGDKKATNA